MSNSKTSIPVLLPNHPVIRMGEDGIQMKVVFTHEAIERILNNPQEGHYNPDYPIGSLMGVG